MQGWSDRQNLQITPPSPCWRRMAPQTAQGTQKPTLRSDRTRSRPGPPLAGPGLAGAIQTPQQPRPPRSRKGRPRAGVTQRRPAAPGGGSRGCSSPRRAAPHRLGCGATAATPGRAAPGLGRGGRPGRGAPQRGRSAAPAARGGSAGARRLRGGEGPALTSSASLPRGMPMARSPAWSSAISTLPSSLRSSFLKRLA